MLGRAAVAPASLRAAPSPLVLKDLERDACRHWVVVCGGRILRAEAARLPRPADLRSPLVHGLASDGEARRFDHADRQLRVGVGDWRWRLRLCVTRNTGALELACTPMPRHVPSIAVLDVHEEWCGPCTAFEATYRRLALDLSPGQLKVFSVARPKLTDGQRAALPGAGGAGCRPLVLVYKVRRRAAMRYAGEDVWVFTRTIPRCRRSQDGSLIGKVVGANGPALEALVRDNLPSPAP